MLTERQLEVLLSVVYEYIHSGESVGSRTVSKHYLKGRSAATIRNEMADLEELGFLTQPHTSAGRIPTKRAFRIYIDSVLQRHQGEFQQRAEWLEDLKSHREGLEGALSYASDLLGRLTQYVGVAALAPLGETRIQHVNFVRVDSRNVMIIVVLPGGLIHHRVVAMPCDMSQETLDELSRGVNAMASGASWKDLRKFLLQHIREELSEYEVAFRNAIRELDSLLSEQDFRIFTGSTSHILTLPDFQDLGRLQALFSLLEEEKEMAKLLKKCSLEEGVQVLLDEDETIPQMKDCAVVIATPKVSEGIPGKPVLGIVGPIRMDYERVISILDQVLYGLVEEKNDRRKS